MATINLNSKLGDMEFDGLIYGMEPAAAQKAKGTIKRLATAATMTRGTILEKKTVDGYLYVLGTNESGAEPWGILCDDTAVGTSAEVDALCYLTGDFNLNKCTVAASYTITDANKEALREKGIFLHTANAAL